MRNTYAWLGLFVLVFGVLGGVWYGVESGLFGGGPAQPAAAATTEPPPKPPLPGGLRGADTGLPPDGLGRRNIALEKRAWQAKHAAYLASLPTAPGQEIGSFSTSLAGRSAEGRVINIKLASEKLDGTILMPGEILSFNDTLGDSNLPSGGWQLATVIVGKEFVQGYGGGICQVSSTLYNSVLRAGLQVEERYTHSLPVGYVEPGQDATVSYPELDFRFRNNLNQPVRLRALIENGLVTCKLYALPAEEL